MGDKTSIEWTDATWSPMHGCTKVSPGCDHCYAEGIAHRFAGTKAYPDGFGVTLRPERLDQPLRWTRPRRIFVCSMGDLFHDDVPDDYIAQVWAVMSMAKQHTFQVLTKRHARLRAVLNSAMFRLMVNAHRLRRGVPVLPDSAQADGTYAWPLQNVWVGVSAEDQQWAETRVPFLLETPAVVRWVSAEPLLGALDLRHLRVRRGVLDALSGDFGDGTNVWAAAPASLDWVVAGGESGTGARPMHIDWVRTIRDQCANTRTAFLLKQWGEWTPMAPLVDGKFRFTGAHSLADDGTLYEPGALAYPDGPRYGEALRAGHERAHLTHVYKLGKKATGRELDDTIHDQYPEAHPRVRA